jgi:hypothetical protein
MSIERNMDRWLERSDRGPEREDEERQVDEHEEARSAVDETLPPRDEDEVELQREHSESDDPQP